jgi:hypothetical protein
VPALDGHPGKKTPKNILGWESPQRATNAKNLNTPTRSIYNADSQKTQSELDGHPGKKTPKNIIGWLHDYTYTEIPLPH